MTIQVNHITGATDPEYVRIPADAFDPAVFEVVTIGGRTRVRIKDEGITADMLYTPGGTTPPTPGPTPPPTDPGTPGPTPPPTDPGTPPPTTPPTTPPTNPPGTPPPTTPPTAEPTTPPTPEPTTPPTPEPTTPPTPPPTSACRTIRVYHSSTISITYDDCDSNPQSGNGTPPSIDICTTNVASIMGDYTTYEDVGPC